MSHNNLKTISADGNAIAYLEKGSGPTVLYIHGNTASHIWWTEVMDLPGYRVIAVDLPNCGASEQIDTCSPPAYGTILLSFLSELNISEAVVVAHSLGGAAAYEMAITAPEKIKGLFLLDACPVNGLKTPKIFHPMIKKYLTDRELFKKAMKSVMGSRGSDEDLLNLLVDEAYRMNHKCFIGHAEQLGKVDYRKTAGKFTGPVRFFVGANDPIIKEKHAKKTMKYFNGDYEIIPDIGHSLQLEKPELFIEKLSSFLRDIYARS
ncbi:alpha/beta fold hydrolase [Salinispira pacifica]|uniref:Putative hydrolase n=1 Tax=Salinispira pacifica TaxID=1307761 RepID=V5WNQ6_9SPIO|nr:alpha/beta hydrolase [Salinispira pacifica]AHC16686.1 putative hydrolase [Salinispira pacifica]